MADRIIAGPDLTRARETVDAKSPFAVMPDHPADVEATTRTSATPTSVTGETRSSEPATRKKITARLLRATGPDGKTAWPPQLLARRGRGQQERHSRHDGVRPHPDGHGHIRARLPRRPSHGRSLPYAANWRQHHGLIDHRSEIAVLHASGGIDDRETQIDGHPKVGLACRRTGWCPGCEGSIRTLGNDVDDVAWHIGCGEAR
jgi:hypothetical protein